MPISPDQACKNLTPAEQEAYDAITKVIDEALMERYQGVGDKVKVEFDNSRGYTERVRQKMFKAYAEAGWGDVQITGPKYHEAQHRPEGKLWAELSKEKPRSCSAWD